MAVLFRPWAHSGDDLKHQDSTISTTTSPPADITNSEPKKEISDISREVKFLSVKEHMKKRSEKRCRRTLLKCDNEILGGAAETHETEITEPSLILPSPFPLPLHLPGYPAKFFDPLDRMLGDGIDEVSLGSPELIEAALSQGLQPGLVGEYARILTEQQRQIAERNRKQRPKKFRCPHCQVGFSNNGQLKGHIRIHTGERPFKCEADNCGKSFTRNEELTRHRRIHSGLRPFPCSECGKRFGRKDHLKKHIRTHFQQRYQLVPIFHSHYPYLFI